MIPGCGLWTSDIADQHVCGSRMTIVPLRFDEGVIYQKSRALQILSLAGIAGERPSIHSSEQVTRLRIAHGGFRYDKGDRAVSVKAASRQGPDLRFRRDANNQTHDSGSNGPILESDSSIRIRSHPSVKLLARGRVRVPDDPPSAALGHGSETGYFHRKHQVACRRRLTGCNVVDGQRSRS